MIPRAAVTHGGYGEITRGGVELAVYVQVDWSRAGDDWKPDEVLAETVPPNTPGPVTLTSEEEARFITKFRPCH